METEHILAEHPDVAIQTLQDKIIKDMDGLPLLLTSEEFRILRIMLKTAAPMTTQGIANCYASLMLNDLCEKVSRRRTARQPKRETFPQ